MKNQAIQTLESHLLEKRYTHLRVPNPSACDQLTRSIERHGQRVPVSVMPSRKKTWVLLDGYRRLAALSRLGKDTVLAYVNGQNQTNEAEALLALLQGSQARHWSVVEESLLLRELHQQQGLSQAQLSHQIGRSQAWVSGRLSLLDDVPEFVLEELLAGQISIWIALRILSPIARAIPAHGESLLRYLSTHPDHSTRQWHVFYKHYQKSNQIHRLQMVCSPDLFFKSYAYAQKKKQAQDLAQGPEGRWYRLLSALEGNLSHLITLSAQVFCDKQSEEEREALRAPLERTYSQFKALLKKSSEELDAQAPTTPTDT